MAEAMTGKHPRKRVEVVDDETPDGEVFQRFRPFTLHDGIPHEEAGVGLTDHAAAQAWVDAEDG